MAVGVAREAGRITGVIADIGDGNSVDLQCAALHRPPGPAVGDDLPSIEVPVERQDTTAWTVRKWLHFEGKKHYSEIKRFGMWLFHIKKINMLKIISYSPRYSN